jgi:hypothetical protein
MMSKLFHIVSSFSLPLGRVGVGFLLVVLTACGVNQLPIDDAYYWPDKSAPSTTTIQTTPTTQITPITPTTPTTPIEYTSVTDTVVTIRIKK